MTGDRAVRLGHAGHVRHRRLPAQQLLDRARDERRGRSTSWRRCSGCSREEREEARERVGDGVEAGDEEQEADVEDLLAGEALAVDLGVEELGEDVVLRVGEPLVEDRVEVRVDLLAGVALDLQPLLGRPCRSTPGRRMPSFRRRKVSSSSHGRPMRPRNTDDGNGSANSLVKWHSPRSTNWSMKWLTRSVTSSSIASIRFGANIGSRILRYFTWSGGSTLNGMSGRTLPRSRKPSDENTLVVLERRLDRRSARHHEHAGHGLHDLGLDELLVAGLRARGFGEALRRQHHRRAVAAPVACLVELGDVDGLLHVCSLVGIGPGTISGTM